MELRSWLRGRCLAALAAAALGCAAVGCVVSPDAPNGSDDGVLGRKLTPEERAREVGRRLAEVRPGMTRREVEAILGPPDREHPNQFGARWETGPGGEHVYVEYPYVVYYASPPNLPPGPYVMAVGYRGEPLAPIPPDAPVVDVSGPLIPEAAPPRGGPGDRD